METALSIRNFFYIIDESMIRRSSHHFHHYLRQKNITIGILATRACEFATQDLLDIFRSSGHRCPKLGSKKSTKTVEKPPHKSGRKGTTTTTTTDAPAGRHLQVKWGADRTNWLLDWLNQNPEDRNRLFSASAAAAKEPRSLLKVPRTAVMLQWRRPFPTVLLRMSRYVAGTLWN